MHVSLSNLYLWYLPGRLCNVVKLLANRMHAWPCDSKIVARSSTRRTIHSSTLNTHTFLLFYDFHYFGLYQRYPLSRPCFLFVLLSRWSHFPPRFLKFQSHLLHIENIPHIPPVQICVYFSTFIFALHAVQRRAMYRKCNLKCPRSSPIGSDVVPAIFLGNCVRKKKPVSSSKFVRTFHLSVRLFVFVNRG